jgi:predicted phage tail protein
LPAVIEINSLAGNVGAEIVVSGTGFVKDGTVTVEYDNELVTSTTTNASGIFITSFHIPISAHGEHIMIISDGLNTKELTFTVESEAPAKPNLLFVSPLVVKEGTDILLDWEDVMDKSMPVTYTLQLASNDSFSAGSILLEKTELPDSEYLMDLSKTQSLRPRRSYYWRVRAVDSAANAGEWTKAGEIKIAPISKTPDWLMYALAVLGALLILFILYMIRRAEKRSS